jgi:oligosaccharide repeat unit polymerase
MMVLDILVLSGLLALVYYQYRRSGILVSPGAAALLMNVILGVYFAYPFALTYQSLETIHQLHNYEGLSIAADKLLGIVMLGTFSALLAYRYTPRLFPRLAAKVARRSLQPRSNLSELTLGACISALLGVASVWTFFYAVNQIPFLSYDPAYTRSSLGYGSSFRAFQWVGTFVSTTGCSFLLAGLATGRLVRYKLLSFATVIATLVTNLLTASRTPFILPILVGGLVYSTIGKKKFTLVRAFMWTLGLFVVVALIQAHRFRTGVSLENMWDEVISGNTNSPFRDNAWLLMKFEDNRFDFYHGKTVIAGYIPSRFLPFKEDYNWGAVTLNLVHWTDRYSWLGIGHVYFGDWYFNFGYPGVIFVGVLMGLVFRLFDLRFFRLLGEYKRLGKPDFYSMFRVWFFWHIACFAFANGTSMFVAPRLNGYFIMITVAAVSRKVSQVGRKGSGLPDAVPFTGLPLTVSPGSWSGIGGKRTALRGGKL